MIEMGKTIHVEGACSNILLNEENKDLQCNNCPFNALDQHLGCFMNFPSNMFAIIPNYSNKVAGIENVYIQELWSQADYPMQVLKGTEHFDCVVLNKEQTFQVFNFLTEWRQRETKEFYKRFDSMKKYENYLRIMQMLMRRAILLEKGIIIRW